MNYQEHDIRKTIGDYLSFDHNTLQRAPSDDSLLCFVGMIEGGEATMDDFEAVGGKTLVDQVGNALAESKQ